MKAKQLNKVDSSFVLVTDAGEKVVADTSGLAAIVNGRKNVELCAAVTAIAQTHDVEVDDRCGIVNRERLIEAMQSASRKWKTTKAVVCVCGMALLKGVEVLQHPTAKTVTGCGACASQWLAQDEDDEFEDTGPPYDPLKVEIDRRYIGCIEQVRATRSAMQTYYNNRVVTKSDGTEEPIPPSLFRMNAKEGETVGTIVHLRPFGGVLGAKPIINSSELEVLLKNLSFGAWSRDDETGRYTWDEVAPPLPIVTHMRTEPDPSVPLLHGITRMPIITQDARVVDAPGYDAESKVFLSPNISIDPIPEHPTPEDVAEAKQAIDDLFFDFPFQSEHTKAAAVGALIEQYVRTSLVDGPCPIYTFEAATGGEGTGKSLLATVISNLVGGKSVIWSKSEEELQKVLLPAIEAQYPVILFDDVTDFVKSGTLNAAVVSREYTMRRLGSNDQKSLVSVPFRSSLFFSLNGCSVDNALARRMIMVRLAERNRQTELDDRGERKYRITNILGHSRDPASKAKYARAALLITRAWMQAGRPIDPDTLSLHSFELWSTVVPSIVRFAGWASMGPAIHAAKTTANTDYADATQFLFALWGDYGSRDVIRAKDIGNSAINHGHYLDRIKVTSKEPNAAVIGRSISKRYMSFVEKWPIKLEDGSTLSIKRGEDPRGPYWTFVHNTPSTKISAPKIDLSKYELRSPDEDILEVPGPEIAS